MTGRGRPHKVKTAEAPLDLSLARPEKPKPVPAPRYPRKDVREIEPSAEEEKPKKGEKPKKRELKQPKCTDEKPSVFPAKIEEKKCIKTSAAGKTKLPEQTIQEKPTFKTSAAGKTKLPEHTIQEKPNFKTSADGKTKLPEHTIQEKPNFKTSADGKTKLPEHTIQEKPKFKTSADGKTEPPERTIQDKPKIKATTAPPAEQASIVEKPDVDRILRTTLDNLKIRAMQRAEAAAVINSIMKTIIGHLKDNTHCFKEINPLRTGSYYENLKISNPDEFDVMLTVSVDRVDIQPFGADGAFYSVALKRGKSPLDCFLQEDKTIGASEMLKDFREEVKKCVKTMTNVELEKKKPGCPAVTLLIREAGLVPISLDVVLGLEVRTSWPPITMGGFQIDGWLGRKVKQGYKRQPYYLVPKYEGKGTLACNGVRAKDAWRISFSHVEKDILKNHGSEKTCCEVGNTKCCRKACLKLLKHLLHLLKEQNPLFSKFCSYHAKTTLFHACCSRTKDSDWQDSHLSHCFVLLLKDFEGHLREGSLSNFFIPTQNLLSSPSCRSCMSLAQRIEEERHNGFPIFLK